MKFKAVILILAAVLLFSFPGCSQPTNTMTKSTPRIPPIDAIIPVKTETATFALGWFWGPDSRFGSIEGVIRTRVGYAGGTLDSPTYHNLGDHSETVQIEFDPTKITYEELLEIFWDSHDPTMQSGSKQYMSIIFYHNAEQKNTSSESMERKADSLGKSILTEVVSFSKFYIAEDYHQKYYLQDEQILFNEFKDMYPEINQLIQSTAAARVNGYIGGYGKFETLKNQLDLFGLTAKGQEKLLQIGNQLPSNN